MGYGKQEVVNIRKEAGYDVYIGRPSPFGNPFVIGAHGTREEVIAKYEAWIRTQPELMERVKDLRGKTLGCWCKPRPCHGDVLLKILNEG